jgi:hypothetical protein
MTDYSQTHWLALFSIRNRFYMGYVSDEVTEDQALSGPFRCRMVVEIVAGSIAEAHEVAMDADTDRSKVYATNFNGSKIDWLTALT